MFTQGLFEATDKGSDLRNKVRLATVSFDDLGNSTADDHGIGNFCSLYCLGKGREAESTALCRGVRHWLIKPYQPQCRSLYSQCSA